MRPDEAAKNLLEGKECINCFYKRNVIDDETWGHRIYVCDRMIILIIIYQI